MLIFAPLALSAAEPPSVTLDIPSHEALSESGLVIVTEMYRRVGYQVHEARLPVRRSLVNSEAGESDGEVLRAAELQVRFPDLIKIPEPLLEFDIVAFTVGGATSLPGGWEDLRGHPLCARLGILIIEDRLHDMTVDYAEDSSQVFRMLKAGRCDYAVLPRTAWIEAETAGIGGLAEARPVLGHYIAYHFLNKRHADLVPALAEALRQLKHDGFTAKVVTELNAAIAAAQADSSAVR